MIATKTPKDDFKSFNEGTLPTEEEIGQVSNVRKLNQLLPKRVITHHHKAGLNPIVDAAAYLFSVLGKLKQAPSRAPAGVYPRESGDLVNSARDLELKSCPHLSRKFQKEIVKELKIFQDAISHYGYHSEYQIVCSYVICATFDDIVSRIDGDNAEQKDNFSLLVISNQDTQHQERFFSIMERAIKEPALYIDLMELMYICLSMGYKGKYSSCENDQYQLEQIIHNLYKHIRAYRGSFSKTLSPTSTKILKSVYAVPQKGTSALFIFFVTACIIMTIFISLGYLMDIISNEAYNNIIQFEKPINEISHKR